jgi:uncharacterized protein YjbI with pentapeptide repeats
MLRLCIVNGLSLLASAAAAFDAEDLVRLKATNACRGCDLSGTDLHGIDLAGGRGWHYPTSAW